MFLRFSYQLFLKFIYDVMLTEYFHKISYIIFVELYFCFYEVLYTIFDYILNKKLKLTILLLQILQDFSAYPHHSPVRLPHNSQTAAVE